MPAKYKVGIFSQSGAMGAAMLDFANGGGFGFSYFVSLGNKADISEIELLTSWADDPNVEVGVGYLEDVKDGPAFIKAARKFTAKKPLIILKGGMTREGVEAARLHTAAMAQDEEVFRAAMHEAGVILAGNLSDMFELAVSFSENPIPKGKRLAIISNAGGPSVVTADSCAFEGIELPDLSARTVHELARSTFAASVENPIDLRGDARDEDYALAMKLALLDSKVDGLLLIISPQRMTEVDEIAWRIVDAKKKAKKPIYVNFLGGEVVSSAREICRENGVSTFTYPERAVRAFRFQADFREIRRREVRELKRHKNHQVARSIIKFSRGRISYEALSKVLSMYGVPMAEVRLARNEAEVRKAAREIKPPLVLKIASKDILHKTDVGGVMLGIGGEDEAVAAYNKIIKNVKNHKKDVDIDGVTVMEMAKEGLEIIVGAKRDPVFGPVLLFGSGGILVELIADFSVAIGPFDRAKVKELMDGAKVAKILRGYRGAKYNGKRLEDVLLSVGRLITEHPEIDSLEINPVILEDDGKKVLGLDGRIEIRKNVLE
ncbi:MAG: acetate--CoA ligase family protein [Patescibacteria group bacterium]|nr:acetate--CoA ligase family protein [Patescibacteria group bacterium]